MYQKIETNVLQCSSQLHQCIKDLQDMKFDSTFGEIMGFTETLCGHANERSLRNDSEMIDLGELFHLCIDKLLNSLHERFDCIEILKPFSLCNVKEFKSFSQNFPTHLL